MEDQVRRGRGRPPAGLELDEATLLRGALEAFAEHGYEGTSVRDIGRRLGLSHALLGLRFGSKQDLWFAAMDHAFQPWQRSFEALDATADDLDLLRAGIHAFVVFAGTHPEVHRIISHEGAIDSPRIHYIYAKVIAPARALAEGLLIRLAASGRTRPIPYASFHLLVTHGAGALFSNRVEAGLLGAPAYTPESVEAHADLITEVIVTGLLRSAP